MSLFVASRKTLSAVTLFAAGTLSPFPLSAADEEASREQISVSDESGLRAALSEKYQPEGTTEEKDQRYHHNADLTLTGSFAVDTAPMSGESADDAPTTGTIDVRATGAKLLGGGNTLSSSALELSAKGSGDLFFLNGVSLSAENVTFAGTTDETKKTGRVFTTGNTAGAASGLIIGAGTVFENRRLAADAFTNYRALGGAIVSAQILDTVFLKTDAAGEAIAFRGNAARGSVVSYENSGGETVSENLSAAGGAVYASGLLKISGAGTAVFESNSAFSEKSSASGGAVFISNASLNADGSAGSAKYPDSFENGDTGSLEFGLKISEARVEFTENSVLGVSSRGGALVVSGGWFEAADSTVVFTGNSARNHDSADEASSVSAGAFSVSEGARAVFGAGTALDVSRNSAVGNAARTTVYGGGAVVSSAAFSLAGTADFSGNEARASGVGSDVYGGALFIAGTLENTTAADGSETKTHTTDAVLAGTLSFSNNRASALALAYSAPSEGDAAGASDDAPTESSALGGALAVNGGKIDGSGLASLIFSENSAESKTSASGGALAVFAENAAKNVTEMTLKTSGEFSFAKNSARLLVLDSSETQTDGVTASARGGALRVSAGALGFSASAGTLSFSENSADASAQADALAQGGAIFQDAGALVLGAAEFSSNKALSSAGTAQGGAADFSGSAQTEFSGAADFSGNSVSALSASGGAVYASGGTQKFSGAAAFRGNAADAGTSASEIGAAFARGGAVFAASGGSLNFAGTAVFENNSAAAHSLAGTGADGARGGAGGGAVYSSGALRFSSAEFSGNSATVSGDEDGAAFGGALYAAGGKISASAAISARGNRAEASGEALGGAVYAASAGALETGGDFSLADNFVSGGTASGGALHSSGTVRVGGTFSATGNSASGAETASGGAVALRGGGFSVSGDGAHEISDNEARATASGGNAFGGAVSVNGANFSQTAGTLTLSGNEARAASGGNAFGGAVYVRGGNVLLTDAEISGNSAAASGGNAFGGAVYVDASSNAASTLTFRGNTKISGNESASLGAGDGICVGAGAGTEAKGSVEIVFDARADVSEDDAGNAVRENVESAVVEDKITIAAAKSFSLKKTGAGDLTLGEISGTADAEISMEFSGGNSTLSGNAAVADGIFKKITVASGATLNVGAALGGYGEASVAGTLNVGRGGVFTFADASGTALAGTLAFADGARAEILGAASVSGAGTFSVKNAEFAFSGADAEKNSLTVDNLSLGAGMLTLSGAGTLTVSEKLVFAEAGTAEISLAAGTTLALAEAARTADGVNALISGTGTLMLYADAGKDSISFPEFSETVKDEDGNETSERHAGTFAIGVGVKIRAGVSVGAGVTLSLAPGAQSEGSRNVLLRGGTLLAPGSSEENPFELESLVAAASDEKSALGEAGGNQVFKMVETTTTETDDEGNTTTSASTKPLSVTGTLEITETTTFVGNVALGSASAAEITGAGTVRGDVSGRGKISLAEIDGNLRVANGNGIAVSGTVNVSGDAEIGTAEAYANAVLTLASGAEFSAANIRSYGRTASGTSRVSGEFFNAGTLTVSADSTLTFAAGSTFRNSLGGKGGTIDLSASGSAIDFSEIGNAAENVTVSDGAVRIDATTLGAGDALPLLGLDGAHYENLRIEDVNDYSLSDRFEWDAGTGRLVFLGLNGEAFQGTIYGDLQREGVNRTHDFMRAAQLRGSTRPLTPQIYGENKLQSPYMRGYLEKMRQRGGEVSARAEARHKEELALAEKLNSPLRNIWAQADFSFRDQNARHGCVGYEATISGLLLGASVPVGNWEFGLAFSGGTEEYETDSSAGTRHEATTDAYGLTGYGRWTGEVFDWSFGVAGMYASTDSERGEYSGDFDSLRLGAMTEIGVTLRAQSWLAIRTFLGVSAAYSHAGSFGESGGGAGDRGALDVDSDGAFGVRTNLGISSAFLVTDALQFKVYAAWLFDLGNDTFSLSAYMPGTRTSYVIDSRENETSALEAGAYLHWAFTDSMEIFGGYTGTIRAGERSHAATIGVNCFF